MRVLYDIGHSATKISEGAGVSLDMAKRYVSHRRAKSRSKLLCRCGLPARHPGGCIKNIRGAVGKREKARIVDAVRSGEMPHRIAEQLGLGVKTVLKHSAATRDQMFAAGISCSCGRPIGHRYWCSAKWDAHELPRGRRPLPKPNDTNALEGLLRGESVTDIAQAVGAGVNSISLLRRALTDKQVAQRREAIRLRIARRGRAASRDVMAQIKAAVPRRIDGMLRDDIEAELYLAVIEGRLEAEQIKGAVRSFVSRGLSQWQSAYGPRSLDEKLSAEGNRTLGDTVGDLTAEAQIEQFKIGGAA